MVLEIEPPEDAGLAAPAPLRHDALSHALSFVHLGMHWANHHPPDARSPGGVDASVLWASLAHLFRLSLIPFSTAWMGDTGFAPVPTALHGAVLLAAGSAHRILERRV